MECVSLEQRSAELAPMSAKGAAHIQELLEVIAAIDRRIPQAGRPGERAIARDASSLKCRALRTLAALQDPAATAAVAAASCDQP